MASALVGVTGAMNNLTTSLNAIQLPPDMSVSTAAVEVIEGTAGLSPKERASLYTYFVQNPKMAAPLPKLRPNGRAELFQQILEEIRMTSPFSVPVLAG